MRHHHLSRRVFEQGLLGQGLEYLLDLGKLLLDVLTHALSWPLVLEYVASNQINRVCDCPHGDLESVIRKECFAGSERWPELRLFVAVVDDLVRLRLQLLVGLQNELAIVVFDDLDLADLSEQVQQERPLRLISCIFLLQDKLLHSLMGSLVRLGTRCPHLLHHA